MLSVGENEDESQTEHLLGSGTSSGKETTKNTWSAEATGKSKRLVHIF